MDRSELRYALEQLAKRYELSDTEFEEQVNKLLEKYHGIPYRNDRLPNWTEQISKEDALTIVRTHDQPNIAVRFKGSIFPRVDKRTILYWIRNSTNVTWVDDPDGFDFQITTTPGFFERTYNVNIARR